MARRVRLTGFTGIDASHGEVDVSARVAASACNMDTSRGGLASARGFASHISAPAGAEIRRLLRVDRALSGTATDMIAATDDALLLHKDGAWTPIYANAKSGSWTGVAWMIGDREVFILANGHDDVLKWDGETLSPLLFGLDSGGEDRRRFAHLTLHKERLWGCGDARFPETVTCSQLHSPEKWGPASVPVLSGVDISTPTFQADPILGMKLVFGDVAIFRRGGVQRVFGDNPDNYQKVDIRGYTGPVSEASIVPAADVCWFLTPSGLGVYTGMAVREVDDRKVSHVMRRLNMGAAGTVSGIAHAGRLYFGLPLDGAPSPNALLEFDIARQAYMLHEGVPAASLCHESARRELLLFAGGESVYRMFTGDKLGDALLSAEWVSPWMELDGKQAVKTVTRVDAFGRVTPPDGAKGDAALDISVETERGRVRRRFVRRLPDDARFSSALCARGSRVRVRVSNVGGSAFSLEGGIELTVSEGPASF